VSVDIFLVLDRAIQGVTLPAGHECADSMMRSDPGYVLQVSSFHFGIENAPASGAPGGAGAGKARLARLIVTRTLDSATPVLMQLCGLGASIPEVKLLVRKPGSAGIYLTYVLKPARLEAVTWSGAGQASDEHLCFGYEALRVDYLTQDSTTGALAKVPVSGAWSQLTNSATFP
jgi:type VI secretion system secreted protein Hcp